MKKALFAIPAVAGAALRGGVAAALAFLILAPANGCMIMGGPTDPPLPSASLFSSTSANVNCRLHGQAGCASAHGGRPVGRRSGEACTTAILGFVQFGDMSLKAAAKDGRIRNVYSVDYSAMNLLGSLYMRKCLIVNGQ